MIRNCDICGEEYTAKRPSSRYCSAKCRNRKARGTAVLAEVPPAPAEPSDDSTVAMVRAALEEAGRLKTWRGSSALRLAERIDTATAVMGYAGLVKQLEATMAAALEGVKEADDPVEEILERAHLKLLQSRGA